MLWLRRHLRGWKDRQRVDESLDLCGIPNACAVVALTDNDAVNLDIALAAPARNSNVPLVVRMENDAFAQATSAIFGIATFSLLFLVPLGQFRSPPAV